MQKIKKVAKLSNGKQAISGNSAYTQNESPLTIFISYKWENEERNQWVEKFARDLRRRQIDALLDKWEVSLGESLTDYMTSAIARCDAFLLIITKASVTTIEQQGSNSAVKFEVQLATALRITGKPFRFIGILREGSGPPIHLSDAKYIDFRDDSKYSYSISSLVYDLMGLTEKPNLPDEKDIKILSEPIVYRLWNGLPHERSFLVEPAESRLQDQICNGIKQSIEDDAGNRGYNFRILKTILNDFETNHLLDVCEPLFRYIESKKWTNNPTINFSNLTFQQIVPNTYHHDGKECLVFIFQIVENSGIEMLPSLHRLRYLQQKLQRRNKKETPLITIIVLATDGLLYLDQHFRQSLWWNVFEHVRI